MTNADLSVIHADDHLVVVDKPAGLLSVPGRGPDKQDCVWHRVQTLYPDALVVHRLDQATSGLLVMARGIDAQRQLSRAFAEREVHKRYLAWVGGRLPLTPEWHTIDLPIAPDWPRRPLQIISAQGRPCLTRWRALAHHDSSDCSLLELEPHTGRSHQLRVHLQAIGHPILGDALYGAPDTPFSPRLQLHARWLDLPHPARGERLVLQAPLPADWGPAGPMPAQARSAV